MKESNDTGHVDWSESRWREMLIQQRKFMWPPVKIAEYARWLKLRHGMTAVDVGCGLGFLGSIYWPHFGKGGGYIGIDESEKLLREAAEGARLWAGGGEVEFVKGDAYKLPLPDDHADWAMCQTLLMHLEHPEKAVEEMIRILKPGGLILCKEPDNLSGALARPYFSAADFSPEENLRSARIQLAMNEGRIKLGRGSQGIGNRVAHMFSELGVTDIDIRMKETAYFLEPPYESERQQHHMRQLRKHYADALENDYWKERSREELLAGGGTIEDFDKHCETMDRFFERALKEMDDSRFSACGAHLFYIVKGRKAK